MKLPDTPHYMLYRLQWDAEKNKFRKKPCRLDGSSLTENEPIPMSTRAVVEAFVATQQPNTYAIGYWLTAEAGYFFIDLDECVSDGQLSPAASLIAAPFVSAGCFFESSSSGRGAHIVGRYTGQLPEHSNKRPSAHQYEFYTRDRGIALNLAAATGSVDIDCTAALLRMLPETFPPRVSVTVALPVGMRRPEWRGPEDDDELIRRALAARGSAATQFGHRASFGDLWNGRVEKNNESDMALASHLAFWTGCDVERMERLMRRSGLFREKWNEHRTYLRELTINLACATTVNVYKEQERKDTAAALIGEPTTDWNAIVEQQVAAINNAGTYAELMDNVVPAIGPLAIPPIRAERIVTALRKRLELFDSKPPVAQLRQLICPPALAPGESARPDWSAPFCYVKRTDVFYNTATGGDYSHESFRMEFARFMPFKPNGIREDPVAWARDRWNLVTVDDVQYRPDQPAFFEHAGMQYANKFIPELMPTPAQPSANCIAAIQAFQQHLYLLIGKRDHLYILLMQWIAHNVQFPGRKIRWSPLIKGVPGDGKSIVGDLLFAAMGDANVKITSISNVSNKGGFTDWATGAAVNFIEEIRLEGKERRQLYNAMKIFIGDTRIDLNRKGRVAGATMVNITNHWANSNYGDSVPVEDGERRWCVIFSPYSHIDEAVAAKGLRTVDELVAHFKWLGTSMRAEPGAWRAWLLGIDTSSFDPDGRAPDTPERESMKMMSNDSLSEAVEDIIDAGGYGITKEVFSSSCLQGRVKIELGDNNVSNNGWHHTLSRMGYQPVGGKTVWWKGKMHRMWGKKPMEAENIRKILDNT